MQMPWQTLVNMFIHAAAFAYLLLIISGLTSHLDCDVFCERWNNARRVKKGAGVEIAGRTLAAARLVTLCLVGLRMEMRAALSALRGPS